MENMDKIDKDFFLKFDKAELVATLDKEGKIETTMKGSTNLLLTLLKILVRNLKVNLKLSDDYICRIVAKALAECYQEKHKIN